MSGRTQRTETVIPAKAGTPGRKGAGGGLPEVPAFAGMTA
jgi:hypothetical protein